MDIRFLLFSSMMKSTELYLSSEMKSKASAKTNSLKTTISKIINKNTFKKTSRSIDSEIETAIEQTKNTLDKDMLDELLAEEIMKSPEIAKYETSAKETPNEIKIAFKSLYRTFVSYAKGTYTKAYGIKNTTRKIVEGPVRMTLAKFLKVFEYVQAAINPHWNMPTNSKFDYDSLAPAVTNHIIINKENFQYESGYIALRYRDQ